jgi:CRP-like cAMP-binding protein
MTEAIPEKELLTFQRFLKIYSSGEKILVEGEEDDKGLFLLRTGKVLVYKNLCGQQELINTIEAVNFFGEVSLFIGGPRTATILAGSETVIVYAFQSPDMSALMSNPTWGSLLVTRLCQNLKEANEVQINLRVNYEELEQKYVKQSLKVAEMFAIMAAAQKAVAQDAVVTSREWRYLVSLSELLHRLLENRTPEIASRIPSIDVEIWQKLHKENILPPVLDEYLLKYFSKHEN